MLEAVRHAPDGIDHGMRLLGPLGGKFSAGDEKHRACDEYHEEYASDCHSGQPGGDRTESDHVEQVSHFIHPARAGGHVEAGNVLLVRLRNDSARLVN
jgi:hypothetical protein